MANAKLREVAFKSAKGKQLAERELVVSRQSHFLAAPPRGEPKFEQILARTTQNLQALEYCERETVVAGKSREELSKPLPLTGKAKTAQIRVVFYYGPFYSTPDSV